MTSFDERLNYLREPILVINQLGLYLPVILVVSLSMIPLGLLHSDNFTPLGFYLVGGGTLLTAPLRGIFWKPTRFAQTLIIVLYIAIGISMPLFVSGFNSPFTFFWLMLLLAAYANFGLRGFVISVTALFAAGVADVFIKPHESVAFYLTVFFYCTFISIMGYILARILRLTTLSQIALHHSRGEEATQRDRLSTLLNSMAEGVLTTNLKGTIKLQNSAILSLLDTNQSAVGKNLSDIFTLTDKAGAPVAGLDLLQNVKAIQVREDLTHHYDDNDTIRLSIQIAPIRSSFRGFGEPGYVLILRDITKEKSLEEERDEFISVVSHELRTPITIAEGSIGNLVYMQKRNLPQDTIAKAAESAHEQVLFLAKMVNDLSTLSRAERDVGAETEEVDTNDLLHDLYKQYHPEAKKKGLTLDLDVPKKLPAITTSRLYLEEMLQNFLTNSLKYTREGSITLAARHTDGKITFTVKDTGIGISKSDQGKIFNKFYRSEDYRTRETGGTGLGLYVVKKLADKLGAHIQVTSRLNHGSSFGFSLPTSPTKQQ